MQSVRLAGRLAYPARFRPRVRRSSLAALWLALALVPADSLAVEVPAYRSSVNDLADLLSTSEVRNLEERIARYRDTTGIEIGILTLESIEGASPEDFAHDVFNKWGLGARDRDNGVLFLVAWNDHVARLEVGYGLESALTDLEAGRIVSKRSIMAEHFRQGDVRHGIEAALDGIQTAVAGDYDPPDVRPRKPPTQMALLVFFAFMMFIMFISAMARRKARRLGVWGHGSWGAGPGGFGGLGGLGGFGRGLGGGRSSGGGFTFGGGSSGGGGASGGW